ncbi:SufS family cysteine desulfurase [Gemella sp. GH3]|nr:MULTISPECIES: SufS family cysteine desulfurase [unclassified Gemella]MBF0714374.1 SufS family cysteine desulfurase [Gemella sp. GH3.1]NYS51326.1 SufS family cysteine desulfurase [Gemella sp. GH3]
MNIENIRKQFPILKRQINDNSLVYFDNGATTQKPDYVIDAITNFYSNYNANIHRSVYTLGNEAENIYIDSKRAVKNFINARFDEEIIYGSGTTELLNLVANMLEQELTVDDEIILSSLEHHANFIPWQQLAKRKKLKLKILEVNKDGFISLNELENSITDKTKIVSLTYASNILGILNDVEKIGQIIRKKNKDLYYVIDAAQAAPHIKIDVQKIDCDFLAFSAHKMCGPTGIGVLYGKKKLLERINPVKYGGGMISIVNDKDSSWAELPNKFEAGTPLLAQAAGLKAAIEYINNIGLENIEIYTKELTRYLLSKLKEIEGLTIYGCHDVSKRVSLVAFNLENVHPHDLASFLDARGICIRAGHQCTQPLLNRLEVFSVARVSLYFYNTKDEIDIFIQTLKETKEFFNNELF